MTTRRDFLKTAAVFGAGALAGRYALTAASATGAGDALPFRISLAQWSLHRAFRSGEKDPLDFAHIARAEFGIDAIEYVNQFYAATLSDKIVAELKSRAEGEGVRSLLIMCDGEGRIGAPTEAERIQTVENHKRWADAAAALGCHSIRVNAASEGTYEEQQKYAADGLVRLAEYCAPLGLNVLVENHGGLSSTGAWLAGVMRLADHPRVGTLPDFGNFIINRETGERYDRYQGVRELMPWARAVSAKSHEFDPETGEEVHTDYRRMMRIVLDAGYHGHVGVEYEGSQ
ncbi:MAG: sugar phosphate isomerase/epimerase, partial [Verrucomicrobia bacterium]